MPVDMWPVRVPGRTRIPPSVPPAGFVRRGNRQTGSSAETGVFAGAVPVRPCSRLPRMWTSRRWCCSMQGSIGRLIVLRCDGERTKALRVSIYGQSDEDRATLEHERDEQERHMKANTSDSSHWRNKTHGALPLLKTSKIRGDVIVKQNFHLFSLEAMEQLMVDIENTLERPRTKAMPIARMLQHRGK